MRIERRTAARGLLLTPTSRVLLLDAYLPWLGRIWMVPGGGVEANETLREAATREIWEETGLADARVGPEVWWRRVRIDFPDRQMQMVEHFFLVQVDEFAPSREQLQENEREVLLEQRWWDVGDLASSQERSAPQELATLIVELLREGPATVSRQIASVVYAAEDNPEP